MIQFAQLCCAERLPGASMLLTAFLTLSVSACGPGAPSEADLVAGSETPRVSGRIDERFTKAFLEAYEGHNRIAVSSTGGEGRRALVMGRALAPRELHLIIDDYCYSACATSLMPSADTVMFGRDAMVAFHDSLAIARRVYVRDFGANDACYVRSGDGERALYRMAGRDPAFHDEVFERLQPGLARAEDIGDVCPRIHYDLTHAWWFPTSEQLREFMGLEFTGSVCADDPACMRQRLPRLDMEGTVMVGDDIWTLPLD